MFGLRRAKAVSFSGSVHRTAPARAARTPDAYRNIEYCLNEDLYFAGSDQMPCRNERPVAFSLALGALSPAQSSMITCWALASIDETVVGMR